MNSTPSNAQINTSVRKRAGKKNRAKKMTTADHVGAYASDAYSLARRTAQGLDAIRRLINVELKFSGNANSTLATQAGPVDMITNIAQGTDVSNRVGDSIKLQHIALRGNIVRGSIDCTVRLILFRDLQNAGATPAGSDLVENAGTSGAVYSFPSWFNSMQSSERFTILYDESFVLDTVTSPIVLWEYETAHQGHVKYRGTTSGAASSGNGAIFLCLLTSAAATQPTVNYASRVTYTDD